MAAFSQYWLLSIWSYIANSSDWKQTDAGWFVSCGGLKAVWQRDETI